MWYWYCFQTPIGGPLKGVPALVVQADHLGTRLPQTVVAMITSNVIHPSRVMVISQTQAARQSGLIMDSVIMTDNLATIDDSEIHRVLGRFPAMNQVDAALRATLSV